MAEDLARPAATAIDNARLYDEAKKGAFSETRSGDSDARPTHTALGHHDRCLPTIIGTCDEDGVRMRHRDRDDSTLGPHMNRLIKI